MIKHKVEKLIARYQTNDPFSIANELDIQIIHCLLPVYIRGFFTKIFESVYIVINNEQHPIWKRAICAHELGHALLHDHLDYRIITMNTRFYIDRFEREANVFASYLLTWDSFPEEGETLEMYSKRIQVPIEILKYVYEEYRNEGIFS